MQGDSLPLGLSRMMALVFTTMENKKGMTINKRRRLFFWDVLMFPVNWAITFFINWIEGR